MTERSSWVSRALVLVLVAMGVVAALFTFLRQRDDGAGKFHPENSYVAITRDGQIEKRESDGTLIRLMREDLAVQALDPGDGVRIVVTPDGRYAYHDAGQTACNEVKLRAIARIDLVRGFTELAAVGQAPSISADGRKLAYVTDAREGSEPFATLDGERPICGSSKEAPDQDGPKLLVVRDLGDRTEVRWGPPKHALGLPRWLADNRQLRIGRGRDEIVLDTTQVGLDLDELDPQTDFEGVSPVQFFSRNDALVVSCDVDDGRVITTTVEDAFDPACRFSLTDADGDGRVRSIAVLRGFGDNLHTVQLHPSGDRLLAGWSSAGQDVMLSYVLGAKKATVLGDDVVAAAWLTN